MKVMRVLCSLTAISTFCAVQARHPAYLFYGAQNKSQEPARYPKTHFWQYFSKKRNVPQNPTIAARLKSWWNTPKPQKITPVLAQENPWLKQLEPVRKERDVALNRWFTEKTQDAYDNYKIKSQIYDAEKYKVFDLGEPERLMREARERNYYGRYK